MFVNTTKGLLNESALRKQLVVSDEPDAFITATEYYLNDELVKRDVNIALKSKNLFEVKQQEF